jgi:hypothetical protein
MRLRPRHLIRALLIAGALALALAAIMLYSVEALSRKLDPDWKPNPRVLMWARIWCNFYRTVPIRLLLAVLHNEAASTPRPLREDEALVLGLEPGTVAYPPGDLHIRSGPAVGCGQVLRANVERLWSDQRLGSFTLRCIVMRIRSVVIFDSWRDLAKVGNERGAVWVTVMMLRDCLVASGGDIWDAARRYNGGAVDNTLAERAYADRAIELMNRMA